MVGPGGTVVGVDLNEAMLTVARRVRPDIDWRQGDAAALPFDDGSFDAVLCQMALMFFPDRPGALRRDGPGRRAGRHGRRAGARRARRPGRVRPFVDMAARHAGPEARSLLSTYFACGDLDELTALFEQPGCGSRPARTEVGTYRAPSVDAFVTTEVESTPLVQRITEDVYDRIRADAHDVLAPFTTADGRVEAPFEVNVVVARRP